MSSSNSQAQHRRHERQNDVLSCFRMPATAGERTLHKLPLSASASKKFLLQLRFLAFLISILPLKNKQKLSLE